MTPQKQTPTKQEKEKPISPSESRDMTDDEFACLETGYKAGYDKGIATRDAEELEFLENNLMPHWRLKWPKNCPICKRIALLRKRLK